MEKTGKNIFWLTASRATSLLFLFLAFRQLFRYLQPFGTGQYQFVLSYVMIFSTVVDFGVLQFITKKMSEQPEGVSFYFRKFFRFEIVAAFLLYAVMMSIGFFKNYDPLILKAVAVAGLGMVINALCFPFLAVLTVKQDIKKVAFINFLNSLVNVTIILLAIWFKKYIVFLASIQLVFGILDLVLYYIFCRRYLNLKTTAKKEEGQQLAFSPFGILKAAWPFALLVGFSAIYNRIDIVIISRMLGFEQTGLYSAAYKFFDIFNFFPASVSHVLFPILAALMAKKAVSQTREVLEKYLELMCLFALPLAVGGSVLAKPLVVFMAGNEFEAAAPVLSVLIWAVAILFIYIPVNSLVISQLTKKAMTVTGINVLLNITGNLLLIPILGIKAAAFMTVFSEFVQGTFYFYFIKKSVVDFKFLIYLWKPVLSALVMGLVIWPLREANLALVVILGAMVYILSFAGLAGRSGVKLLLNRFTNTNEKVVG